ncbi:MULTISPECIES: VanZ family protein [Geobacillus]|uniref:VanZ family protein n=1 Tax=Geobacillus TaxID=129337 RepID=UPI0005396EAB|nr:MULTISPECIES: VanZ family protein [Geobacillus thermoleovorans group]MBW7644751.1 VanZ family protein [Geobacillus thermoleovorans]MED3669024.1 VanZ family protein [Geobacillus kaustophilus]QDY73939.1 VanZ family protein [Geobacillus thermoleovorans]QNU21263.1 VanZ family protein [Geobacillus thermoleovorans]
MRIFVKVSLTILLCIYLSILTKIILFKYLPLSEIINHFDFSYNEYLWRSSNFIPFKTIIYYLFLADINLNIRIENLVGNIIGFVPLGFTLPLLSKRFQNLKAVIITTSSLSFTYEILQLLFGIGSFDIDDLILNTLGGVMGYLPIKLIYLTINSKKKYQNNKITVS